ncbi:hypothetical protein Asp14428_36850 [Actinoplanes sp. NBRC 14428]|uniref:Uncharacterized protein n=1 Tax=Pseudosporangium ferrugineum TaxID=439699 RepID=A0A2T0S3T0_9ACTN|nr:hypothetical protein [Pseudosporangium ferrugineum]PRY28084.1 hypothetical protein CLV70_109241 [Pseudosporangium ferrugineum]BCJ52210.1 hypothetical protein Asp14428_36850 [Actinoplanes sp. NBRC 14428]
MKHYLLIFDRVRGEVLREEEFLDRATALKARFKAERAGNLSKDIEVVILGADSADALRRTHARYFRTAGELARTDLAGLTGA